MSGLSSNPWLLKDKQKKEEDLTKPKDPPKPKVVRNSIFEKKEEPPADHQQSTKLEQKPSLNQPDRSEPHGIKKTAETKPTTTTASEPKIVKPSPFNRNEQETEENKPEPKPAQRNSIMNNPFAKKEQEAASKKEEPVQDPPKKLIRDNPFAKKEEPKPEPPKKDAPKVAGPSLAERKNMLAGLNFDPTQQLRGPPKPPPKEQASDDDSYISYDEDEKPKKKKLSDDLEEQADIPKKVDYKTEAKKNANFLSELKQKVKKPTDEPEEEQPSDEDNSKQPAAAALDTRTKTADEKEDKPRLEDTPAKHKQEQSSEEDTPPRPKPVQRNSLAEELAEKNRRAAETKTKQSALTKTVQQDRDSTPLSDLLNNKPKNLDQSEEDDLPPKKPQKKPQESLEEQTPVQKAEPVRPAKKKILFDDDEEDKPKKPLPSSKKKKQLFADDDDDDI